MNAIINGIHLPFAKSKSKERKTPQLISPFLKTITVYLMATPTNLENTWPLDGHRHSLVQKH